MKKVFICILSFISSISASAYLSNYLEPVNSKTEQVAIYKECKRCDGKGYMTIRKKCTCLGNYECNKCGGDGIIETKHKCSTCNGTGKIRVK